MLTLERVNAEKLRSVERVKEREREPLGFQRQRKRSLAFILEQLILRNCTPGTNGQGWKADVRETALPVDQHWSRFRVGLWLVKSKTTLKKKITELPQKRPHGIAKKILLPKWPKTPNFKSDTLTKNSMFLVFLCCQWETKKKKD